MRAPQEKERVRCPECGEKMVPKQCWESRLPDGASITYGLIPEVHQKAKAVAFYQIEKVSCEGAGLAGPVEIQG